MRKKRAVGRGEGRGGGRVAVGPWGFQQRGGREEGKRRKEGAGD